jgi:hypothetical protein
VLASPAFLIYSLRRLGNLASAEWPPSHPGLAWWNHREYLILESISPTPRKPVPSFFLIDCTAARIEPNGPKWFEVQGFGFIEATAIAEAR